MDTLVEKIIEPKDFREREERIINFLKERLTIWIFNMEDLFEKSKASKKEKKRYERFKEALEILDEHYETMKYMVNKEVEYEEAEMEETGVEEDEYEEYSAEHDDGGDDMEVDFMSGEVRKSEGGKA
jgi:alpha-galactosidase/6-phospho-beta-glucosidase family protein